MASKGVTRTGEAYCLSCHQMVERVANKCQGCLSELTSEVKAFSCPKCKTVMALGEPQCPTCGLRFKVKSIKPKEKAEDDQFLIKLIEWGKDRQEAQPASRPAAEPQVGQGIAIPSPVPEEPAEPAREAQISKLAQLKDSIRDLMANRSEMLERMEKRLEEEKSRLARISAMDDAEGSSAQVEAEIVALADEMADITMLQAHMDALSEEISSLLSSVEISSEAKERGLAARALKKKLEAKEREVEELRAKEEQLVKREEMVDRKIHAYAQKKKELDEKESELQTKLAELEKDRADLERLRTEASGASTATERERAAREWLEQEGRIRQRVKGIHSAISTHRFGKQPSESEMQAAEGSLDELIAGLEEQIGTLMAEKSELQAKTQEATMLDEDIKKLLRVLDQMLGQLPEDVIERFSKSDDFALYERILDRFKI